MSVTVKIMTTIIVQITIIESVRPSVVGSSNKYAKFKFPLLDLGEVGDPRGGVSGAVRRAVRRRSDNGRWGGEVRAAFALKRARDGSWGPQWEATRVRPAAPDEHVLSPENHTLEMHRDRWGAQRFDNVSRNYWHMEWWNGRNPFYVPVN